MDDTEYTNNASEVFKTVTSLAKDKESAERIIQIISDFIKNNRGYIGYITDGDLRSVASMIAQISNF